MTLTCRNLTKEYKRGVKALNNFCAEFSCGIYGMLGPNGAGKSTLINILAKLIRPTGGNVLWNDQDIMTMGGEYRKLIGYVPQDPPVYGWMTGRAYLQYIYQLKDLPPERAEASISDVLAKVELTQPGGDKISSYSGGMRHRLGIAQALLGNPAILLLDEPTAGLDPRQRAIIKNQLRALARDTIIIICTHIVSDLADIADQILMMRSGCLLDMLSPDVWLEKMAGKVWWIPESDDALIEYPTAMRYLHLGNSGLRIISDDPPVGAKPLTPTLEDIYLQCYSERVER